VVLTRLKLLPLMQHERPLEEVVREVAALTRVLPQAVWEEAIGTMLGLGYNYLVIPNLEGFRQRVATLKGS